MFCHNGDSVMSSVPSRWLVRVLSVFVGHKALMIFSSPIVVFIGVGGGVRLFDVCSH
jgi:hypothetical protein